MPSGYSSPSFLSLFLFLKVCVLSYFLLVCVYACILWKLIGLMKDGWSAESVLTLREGAEPLDQFNEVSLVCIQTTIPTYSYMIIWY